MGSWDRSPTPGSRAVDGVGAPGLLLSGRYELRSLIGTGGMGEVWEARHLALDKVVAVKLLRGLSGGPTAHARLLQEARLLATLRHPALVEVFDFGETDAGIPYFVMERVTGGSLADALERRGPLPPAVAVNMGIVLSEGLARAHAAGVIHRDVKPDNVLLSLDEDGTLRPKLVDFGVAYVARESSARLTAADGLIGTPEYMSPEAIRGVESRERADVWGLALTVYESLTGVSPFRASDPISAFRRVLDDELPPLERAGIEPALYGILAGALQKDHESRTRSVAGFGAALRGWLSTRGDTMVPPPLPPTDTGRRSPRASTALAPARAPLVDDEAPPSLDALIRSKLRG